MEERMHKEKDAIPSTESGTGRGRGMININTAMANCSFQGRGRGAAMLAKHSVQNSAAEQIARTRDINLGIPPPVLGKIEPPTLSPNCAGPVSISQSAINGRIGKENDIPREAVKGRGRGYMAEAIATLLARGRGRGKIVAMMMMKDSAYELPTTMCDDNSDLPPPGLRLEEIEPPVPSQSCDGPNSTSQYRLYNRCRQSVGDSLAKSFSRVLRIHKNCADPASPSGSRASNYSASKLHTSMLDDNSDLPPPGLGLEETAPPAHHLDCAGPSSSGAPPAHHLDCAGPSSSGAPPAHDLYCAGSSSSGAPPAHDLDRAGSSSSGAPPAHDQDCAGSSSSGAPPAHDLDCAGSSSSEAPPAHDLDCAGSSSSGAPPAHDLDCAGSSSSRAPPAHDQDCAGSSSSGVPPAHDLDCAGSSSSEAPPAHDLDCAGSSSSGAPPAHDLECAGSSSSGAPPAHDLDCDGLSSSRTPSAHYLDCAGPSSTSGAPPAHNLDCAGPYTSRTPPAHYLEFAGHSSSGSRVYNYCRQVTVTVTDYGSEDEDSDYMPEDHYGLPPTVMGLENIEPPANSMDCAGLSSSGTGVYICHNYAQMEWFEQPAMGCVSLESLQTPDRPVDSESFLNTINADYKDIYRFGVVLAKAKVLADNGSPIDAAYFCDEELKKPESAADSQTSVDIMKIKDGFKYYIKRIRFMFLTGKLPEDSLEDEDSEPEAWVSCYILATFYHHFAIPGCCRALNVLSTFKLEYDTFQNLTQRDIQLCALKARILGKVKYLAQWCAGGWKTEMELLAILCKNTPTLDIQMIRAQVNRMWIYRTFLENKDNRRLQANSIGSDMISTFNKTMKLYKNFIPVFERIESAECLAWLAEELLQFPNLPYISNIDMVSKLISKARSFPHEDSAYFYRVSAFYYEKSGQVEEAVRQHEIADRILKCPMASHDLMGVIGRAYPHVIGTSSLERLPNKEIHIGSYYLFLKKDPKAALKYLSKHWENLINNQDCLAHRPVFVRLIEPISLLAVVMYSNAERPPLYTPNGHLHTFSDICMEVERLKTNYMFVNKTKRKPKKPVPMRGSFFG